MLLAKAQDAPAVRLKVGDTTSIFIDSVEQGPYTGANRDTAPREIPVLADGCIYGFGFGKIKVVGLTVEEAQARLRQSLSRFYLPQTVFFTIIRQRLDLVYVIGTNAAGPMPLTGTGMTVRQLLPSTTSVNDAQRLEVQLVRGGKVIEKSSYAEVLSGESKLGGTRVMPNDFISVVPQSTARVWVVGPVKNPGAQLLPEGSTLYQAVAAAGGIQVLESETKLALRHGPDVTEYPAVPTSGADAPKLAEGDVVTVLAPQQVRVTVGGMVTKPDEFVVNPGTTALGAISKASGLTPEGSLARVFVFRNGQALQFDLSAVSDAGKVNDPKLQAGDLVYVDENRKFFYVFGHTTKNGKYPIEEGKTYRATDALAAAGGLDQRGSMRRVVLYHPNPDGKPTITMFNLDEFLKDGKLAANPEVRPGDALLFSEPKGITLAGAAQTINSFLFLNTFARR